MEYVSPEGLRLDGRRPNEARQLRCQLGPLASADGSALFEMGNTKVLAAVYGPREVTQRSQALHDRCVIRCEYSVASFATGERRKGRGRDRRSTELALVIRHTLEAAVLTELMPRSQIDVVIQVLQADGGQRCCAVNAASMALADAGVPLRDTLASCTAGFLDGTPLLDINYQEEMGNGPELAVATLPRQQHVTLLQMEDKLPLDSFEGVLTLAQSGCDIVAKFMRAELMQRTRHLAVARAVEKL